MTASPFRRAVAAAALALAAAAPAGAQTVTARYPAACPAGPCSVRFDIANTTGAQLLFNSFQLVGTSAAYAFYPVGGAGTAAAFRQRDANGDFADLGALSNGNRTVFLDFLAGGLPFQLDAGALGYVELEVAGAPVLATGAFQFVAVRADNTQLSGDVTAAAVVPEPATVALVAGGLAGLAAAARRRRAA